MTLDTCMLCGRPSEAGLHIMGCLICFDCEKALLHQDGALSMNASRRRKLCRLYPREKKAKVYFSRAGQISPPATYI